MTTPGAPYRFSSASSTILFVDSSINSFPLDSLNAANSNRSNNTNEMINRNWNHHLGSSTSHWSCVRIRKMSRRYSVVNSVYNSIKYRRTTSFIVMAADVLEIYNILYQYLITEDEQSIKVSKRGERSLFAGGGISRKLSSINRNNDIQFQNRNGLWVAVLQVVIMIQEHLLVIY